MKDLLKLFDTLFGIVCGLLVFTRCFALFAIVMGESSTQANLHYIAPEIARAPFSGEIMTMIYSLLLQIVIIVVAYVIIHYWIKRKRKTIEKTKSKS